MLERYLPRTEFGSYEDFAENFSVTIPEKFNFAYDVMDALALEKGGERALLWCDEHGARAEFTYADLKRLSDRAANAFRSLGVGKGDRIMLILKRRHEYWPILLALHKLGAVAIPATHLLTAKDIVYRCNAARVTGIVTVDERGIMDRIDEAFRQLDPAGGTSGSAGDYRAPRFRAFVRQGRGDVPPSGGWGDFSRLSQEAPEEFVPPDDPNANDDIMLLYFTSGTTGMPKMVQHNFVYPLGHILTAKYWQCVRPGGLHLTLADTGWAKAAWGKIYGQWLCGTAIFVYDYERFVPAEMLSVISRNRITTFCAPPTVYRFFVKEDLSHWDFSALEYCCVAGEPLNPEVYERFHAATGLKLREGYGQTELAITLATFPWMEPKPGSMGKPSANYDIDLLREDGGSCDMGEEGQIVIRTHRNVPPGMFNGYYEDPELTASVWHDGVYRTGDVAWRDEDGYYWFVGRIDDVIKSSGYRIGPFEVESALLEHPSVLECAVTGTPDPDRGAAVKATIVLARGWRPSEELKKTLQEHVKKTTAPYKYPRVVEFAEELPKTISGKIRRVQLREGDLGQ